MDLIAYNSKIKKVLFMLSFILVTIVLLVLLILIKEMRLYLFITFLIFLIVTIIISYYLISNKSQIAFEIKGKTIYLYDNNKVSNIEFNEIVKVEINENYGSFDGCIYTKDKKYPMHYLIKEHRKVFENFIKIMKDNRINIKILDVSID